MTAVSESIIEKIKGLLRLAGDGGATAAEAETAAAVAQKLITQHRIRPEALRDEPTEGSAEDTRPIDTQSIGSFSKRPTWAGILARSVAETNGCYVYWAQVWVEGKGRMFNLICVGAEEDRFICEALLHMLMAQVDAAVKREGKGMGRTWANNFRIGMVQRIGERLRRSKNEATAQAREEAAKQGGTAIVALNRAIEVHGNAARRAEEWTRAGGTKLSKRSTRYASNAFARKRGREAGEKATLNHDRFGEE